MVDASHSSIHAHRLSINLLILIWVDASWTHGSLACCCALDAVLELVRKAPAELPATGKLSVRQHRLYGSIVEQADGYSYAMPSAITSHWVAHRFAGQQIRLGSAQGIRQRT